MLDKSNSPLRQRMIEDMTARRFKEKVQKDWRRGAAPSGSSSPSNPSPGLKPSSPILPVIPTASRSPTRGSSPSMRPASPSDGRTIESKARPVQDHGARRHRVHSAVYYARSADRLPPHPPLQPVRQPRSNAQHRLRPPVAGHACAIARTFWRRGLIVAPRQSALAKRAASVNHHSTRLLLLIQIDAQFPPKLLRHTRMSF